MSWKQTIEQIQSMTPEQVNRLAVVFEMVKPSPNWKASIAAVVYKDSATKEEIVEAVTFYCGGVPEVFDLGHAWRVSGAGYYVWCGA